MALHTDLHGAARAYRHLSFSPATQKRGTSYRRESDRNYGRPWLLLAGEPNNTAASDPAYLETVWPKLTRLNLNTVLVAIAWDWVEPEEGRFDISLLDGVLAGARRNNERVVFLWFGSWKNGVSTFAPTWVKADTQRFERVRVGSGVAVEMLTPFSAAAMDADTRVPAFFGPLMT